MTTTDLARRLVDRAISAEQVAHQIQPGDDVAQRIAVRKLARERTIRIRTAVIGDVLAVVRADAAIWDNPIEKVKSKLTPG